MPTDQAAELRMLMAGHVQAPALAPKKSLRRKTARVVAVASGKGGVGKTSIAVNLSLRLSQIGHRVVLVDADLGTANADLLLNVHPQQTLAALIRDGAPLDSVLTPINARMRLIAGASGLASMADLDFGDRRILVEELSQLEQSSDLIVIDCGAGISQNVLAFAQAADDLLLVTTPEPTAVTDAYALVKVLSQSGPLPAIHVVMNQSRNDDEGRQSSERLASVASRFWESRCLNWVGFRMTTMSAGRSDYEVRWLYNFRAARLRSPYQHWQTGWPCPSRRPIPTQGFSSA
ncbi:MAG: MinD/ParA family protein [Planctomycetes bacterium]|nr:MinD/ParA family protein [Planctomycetota bacterium]